VTLDQVVLPLDLVRGASLRFLAKSRRLTRVLGQRETRIASLGAVQVLVLFFLTVRFPVALFFLGPLLFGVVHIAADVRYLALRLAPPRALLLASLAPAALLTAGRVLVGLHVLGALQGARLDTAVGLAWVGVALAARWRGGGRALLLGAPLFAAASGLLLAYAEACEVAVTHLHNVAALVIWLTLFRRRPGWTAVPVALVIALTLGMLSGAFLPWAARHGGILAFGQTMARLGAVFAPGASPRVAMSVVMTLVFLQSVHYAVWTAWIPQECLPGEGTPTFRMTVRSLTADFGKVGLAVVAGTALAFAALACWHFRTSVLWYLTLVRAHTWFELAVFAFFIGRPPTAFSRPGHAPGVTS
jgi:hypothetical protein